MTSARLVVLVWVYFSYAAAQDTMKYIHVSKLKEQGITWHNYSSNKEVTDGYRQINNRNKENGEISYFRGYSQQTSSNRLCPFNLPLHIMTATTPMRDDKDYRKRFWILKQGEKYTGFTISDTVYVSGTMCSGLTELYYASCAKIWEPRHETMYSRISTRANICDGDYKHHERKIYAFVEPTCPTLPDPAHGKRREILSTNGLRISEYEYSCDFGYKIQGDSSIQCKDNGQWSRSAPTCTVVRCSGPSNPPNGRLSSSDNHYGSKVTYICNPGYRLHPEGATITCQVFGLWSFNDMKCQAVRCPSRSDPSNGRLSTSDNRYDSTVTYRCNHGYSLQPLGASIKCQANGQWSSSEMKCQVIRCPSRSEPSNGRLSTSDNRYDSTVTYICNQGYRLKPLGASVRCQANRHWTSNDMKCQVVDCGNPEVTNEVSLTADHGTTYNQTVGFSCRTGSRLQGSVSAVCKDTGRWQFSQNDKPSCLGIRCPEPRQPDNGRAIGNNRVVGSQWTYTCELGYTLVGQETLTCMLHGNSGRWSADVPTCRVMACPTPTPPQNGVVRGGQYTYGSVIHYSCNAGYRLQGTDRSTCRMVGWDGQAPTCLTITCPDPGNSPNAHREGTSLTAGAALTYTCEHGYTMDGAARITCGDDGRWSSRRPQCDPIACPRIRTPRYSSRDGDTMTFGSTVSFLCQPGYQMQGDANTTCKADGTWSNPAPTCVACPIGLYKERREERTCSKCPEHSTTITAATSNRLHCTCIEGAAGPQGGPCTVVKCGVLSAPQNGRLSGSCETGLDSQCDVTCDPGFVLTSGSRRRRCTASGWTGSSPKCTACEVNTYKLLSGATSCTPCPVNTVTTPGEAATGIESCKCAEGFTRNEGSTCSDVDECKVNNGGCTQTCVNTQGSYVCRCHIPGYELTADGKGCVMTQTCSSLIQKPNNGELTCSYTQRTNGHMCVIRCDQGYFFVSGVNNYLTCGPPTDFEWSHRLVNKTARLPSCTREFFVDVELPLRLNYNSTRSCSAAPMDPGALKTRLEATTNSIPICNNKCEVDDLNITCQETDRKMVVAFDVLLQNPHPHEVPFNCTQDCKHRNMRAMLRDTFQLKQKFQAQVKAQPQSFQLTSQGAPTVIPSSFWFGRPRMLCDEGRVLTNNRLCVPCDKGFHLPKRDMEFCLPCPKGSYQNEYGQTRCKPCLDGSTTVSTGADHPTMCSERVEISPDIPHVEIRVN